MTIPNVRYIKDSEALNEISSWLRDNDPVLDASCPDWVWDFVTLVEDVVMSTGRETGGHE